MNPFAKEIRSRVYKGRTGIRNRKTRNSINDSFQEPQQLSNLLSFNDAYSETSIIDQTFTFCVYTTPIYY